MATSIGRAILSCRTLMSAASHRDLQRFTCLTCVQRRCAGSGKKEIQHDVFVRKDVQEIMRYVTGFNLSKVFHSRMADTEVPNYILATDSQLEQLQREALEKGEKKLQFPPVIVAEEETEEILSYDKGIDGHSESKFVFTDITYGVSDKERTIVVREPSGKLRMAKREERNRLLQTYFPRPGKMYKIPQMFNDGHLERLLHEGKYEYILDRACVQFEPDDPNYIKVTQRTYEFVNSRSDFETLRSTRHFGSMVFYLTLKQKPENLMVDMIQRDMLPDAAQVVRLYHILHPGCSSARAAAKQGSLLPLQLIELFCQETSAHGGPVLLAIQAHEDSHKQRVDAS